MKNLNGDLSQKNLSKTFPISSLSTIAEVLFLFGLGALAIILHVKMRTPIGIPGHHGLEFMALLMLGRTYSKLPVASIISSLGVGAMMFFPIWAGKDPFSGAVYMLPGFALDFLYFKLKDKKKVFLLALIGGLAYALIPFARFTIMSLTGISYKSLLAGPLYPIFTFASFGFAGSLFTALLSNKLSTTKKQKKD